jgi:hypothetical protein
MKLYTYSESYGRMGTIEGAFFLTDDEVEKYKKYTGYLYWDEELGKHSEGYFNFSDETLTEIDLPKETVDLLYEKLGKVIAGPFDFGYFDEIIAEQLEEADEYEDDEE